MAKQTWKPGNMIYPIPAVMVSVTDGKGQDDIITRLERIVSNDKTTTGLFQFHKGTIRTI